MQLSLSDWNDAIYLAHSRQILVRSSSGTIHLARVQFILHPIKMNRSIRNLDFLLSIKIYPLNAILAPFLIIFHKWKITLEWMLIFHLFCDVLYVFS